MIAEFTTLAACRNYWGVLFTTDLQLIAKVGELLVILAFYITFDGLSVVVGGTVRGAGKQSVAAPITLASYYLLGLPCAALFAFQFGLGATGLCLGLLLGSAAMDSGFYLLLWRTDWELEARKAAERAGVKNAVKHDGSQQVVLSDVEMQRTAGRTAIGSEDEEWRDSIEEGWRDGEEQQLLSPKRTWDASSDH